MPGSRYQMGISLNVLNHLGLNLYSNTPAVLAEVIANSWDADAHNVDVHFDFENKTIKIVDDGHGMSVADINEKYLYVGYQKRAGNCFHTPGGRRPMGRKGIGKLSLFSIADKYSVYTLKEGGEKESFLMDANKIREDIKSEDPSALSRYEPDRVIFDESIDSHGTIIHISDLKKIRLNRSAVNGLKKRIARRFGMNIISDSAQFCVRINGVKVTWEDRDYFHKARFLFQYGDWDYSKYCRNLDEDGDTGKKLCFVRQSRFDSSGVASQSGLYGVRGWIGIARQSNDLDDTSQDDNLNKITVVVRGKVAQEDILQEFRLGGMITKYMYGEIHADFLDTDDEDDIATSGRQRISEDDSRYVALKKYVGLELKKIWSETNKLKERRGLQEAILANPHVKKWYDGLTPRSLQKPAMKIFGAIDKAGIDDKHKNDFYADGILAFETLKMENALEELNNIDASDADSLDRFLRYLKDVDRIEAARYSEIVRGRLDVIDRLQEHLDGDAKEKVLQEYLFDHLWLLDPAWERATQYAHMEKRIQATVDKVKREYRTDIRYKRVMACHVIVELKRGSRVLDKTDIEAQARRYIAAVREELKSMNERDGPIETVCIVGELPRGWQDLEEKRRDEESLRPHAIRVITYDELIKNARSAYAKFIQVSAPHNEIREMIDRIRSYQGSEG